MVARCVQWRAASTAPFSRCLEQGRNRARPGRWSASQQEGVFSIFRMSPFLVWARFGSRPQDRHEPVRWVRQCLDQSPLSQIVVSNCHQISRISHVHCTWIKRIKAHWISPAGSLSPGSRPGRTATGGKTGLPAPFALKTCESSAQALPCPLVVCPRLIGWPHFGNPGKYTR